MTGNPCSNSPNEAQWNQAVFDVWYSMFDCGFVVSVNPKSEIENPKSLRPSTQSFAFLLNGLANQMMNWYK